MTEAFEGKYVKIKGNQEYQDSWNEKFIEFLKKHDISEQVDQKDIDNTTLEIRKNQDNWEVTRSGPLKTVTNTYMIGASTGIETITGEVVEGVIVNFSRGYMVEIGHRYELIRELNGNILTERIVLNASSLSIEYKRM